MNRVSLVVATQNEAAGHLDALPAVAADLRTLLADPDTGGCTPVDARPTTKADVEQAVSGAIRTAGERGAVLVLAFLGHGFTTDQDSHLYYMAADTRPASPASGVDVSRLLVEAAGLSHGDAEVERPAAARGRTWRHQPRCTQDPRGHGDGR